MKHKKEVRVLFVRKSHWVEVRIQVLCKGVNHGVSFNTTNPLGKKFKYRLRQILSDDIYRYTHRACVAYSLLPDGDRRLMELFIVDELGTERSTDFDSWNPKDDEPHEISPGGWVALAVVAVFFVWGWWGFLQWLF